MQHYIVVRLEFGGCSGPGNGWAGMDKIQVMASSRTLKGARRKQKEIGGEIEVIDGPYRRYERNEFLRYAHAW